MDNKQLKKLNNIFQSYTQIKLVYFFGSRAKKEEGPLSDYDFAVYLDERDTRKMFDIKLELMDKISRLLKTDRIEVVIMNFVESPEMKYNIIREGKLIFEREPFRLIIEPKILNEYFDFHSLLLRHGLTKS